jgi:hypothetical protein
MAKKFGKVNPRYLEYKTTKEHEELLGGKIKPLKTKEKKAIGSFSRSDQWLKSEES